MARHLQQQNSNPQPRPPSAQELKWQHLWQSAQNGQDLTIAASFTNYCPHFQLDQLEKIKHALLINYMGYPSSS